MGSDDQVVRPSGSEPATPRRLAVELGNLDMIFSKKATNTLNCRASSTLRFASWVLKNFPAEPISEPNVFLYCKKLKGNKANSLAADQLLQALNFCSGTLGLAVPVVDLRSSKTGPQG